MQDITCNTYNSDFFLQLRAYFSQFWLYTVTCNCELIYLTIQRKKSELSLYYAIEKKNAPRQIIIIIILFTDKYLFSITLNKEQNMQVRSLNNT